ncbi:MAG: hypothetical protein HY287_07785 [Planctomycetes bacterium]|nr:hypothetical protein [Planctomycetota bacterium]
MRTPSFRPISILLIVAALAATAQAESPTLTSRDSSSAIAGTGATLKFYFTPVPPTSGTAIHYPNGWHISGQTLYIPPNHGGFLSLWHAQMEGWDPDQNGEPLLRSFQGKIDANGFLGVNAACGNDACNLGWPYTGITCQKTCTSGANAGFPCTTSAQCPGSTCGDPCPAALGERGMRCGDLSPNACDWAWQDTSRSDWVFANNPLADLTIGCGFLCPSPTGPNFGGTVNPGTEISDSGGRFYIGTLPLYIPACATGTYTMGFVATLTFAQDDDQPANNIPIADLVPGVLLIGVDCNHNDREDSCDIAHGAADANGNGVPDECDPDCQHNGVPDFLDISSGTSIDCQPDGIPDECQRGLPYDCDGNNIPDVCDLARCNGDPACGDCNGNLRPDSCDIAAGFSVDCNQNGIPDECDIVQCTGNPACADCNHNRVPDACDIAEGTSHDFSGNGIPDECEAGIPAVSQWGLVVLILLLACAAKIRFRARFASVALMALIACQGTSLAGGDETRVTAGTGATLKFYFTPVGPIAESAFQYPSGWHISGQTLYIPSNHGGFLSRWHSQMEGWDPDHDGEPLLRSFQAKISAYDFQGVNAECGMSGCDLVYPYTSITCQKTCSGGVNAGNPCTTNSQCPFSNCGDPCPAALGESGPKCGGMIAGVCDWSWQDTAFPDWIFAGHAPSNQTGCPIAGFCIISPTGPNFAGTVNPGTEILDSGGRFYIGSFALYIPACATGIYTMNFKVDETFAQDQHQPALNIPIADLVPGVLFIGADCNHNDRPDSCDIANGAADVDGNGVPDECQPDCQPNGIPDVFDLVNGTSVDCNHNSIPDECDVRNGRSPDCNANGIPDECDIAQCAGEPSCGDCNHNGVPDACDIAEGTSHDFSGNGIPDECEAGIPAVSQWGLVILILLLACAAKIRFRARFAAVTFMALIVCQGTSLAGGDETRATAGTGATLKFYFTPVPPLRSFQGKLDGTRFLGVNAECGIGGCDLVWPYAVACQKTCTSGVNAGGSCTTNAQCPGSNCGDPCHAAMGEYGPRCGGTTAGLCDVVWQNKAFPDWIFAADAPSDTKCGGVACIISPTGPSFAGTVNPGTEIFDGGIRYYIGTLALYIPACAAGIYTMGFKADETFAQDQHQPANNIPVADMVPGVLFIGDDCNHNGRPDSCDIVNGAADVDGNGVPDECDPDCQPNGIPDGLDISSGTSHDCQPDGIPDECQGGATHDCDGNGIPDECDLARCNGNPACGDCNGNHRLDSCDIAAGLSVDCNRNGIPDECDLANCAGEPSCADCNHNGIPDACDIANGISSDAFGNGIPDECEPGIPTVSAWGLVVSAFVLLIAGKIAFSRRSNAEYFGA